MTHAAVVIARKEIRDHLRDRRSLASTFLYALIGPAAVLLVAIARPPSEPRAAIVLWSMASVFAMVSAFAGSMNVALDLMAGERERRSLVPLLLTPASARDVILGKWIACSLFGLTALAVTIAGCAGVLMIASASVQIAIAVPDAALWVVAGLGPLALLGAACHLLVSSASGSTKEAQTWMSSLVFVPMLLGLTLVFVPAIGETWGAMAPIVGQQAWIGRRLDGHPVPPASMTVVTMTTLAAATMMLTSARRVIERQALAAA
jgi:sodium transport system permease protein